MTCYCLLLIPFFWINQIIKPVHQTIVQDRIQFGRNSNSSDNGFYSLYRICYKLIYMCEVKAPIKLNQNEVSWQRHDRFRYIYRWSIVTHKIWWNWLSCKISKPRLVQQWIRTMISIEKSMGIFVFVFIFHYVRILYNHQKILEVFSAGRPLLVQIRLLNLMKYALIIS